MSKTGAFSCTYSLLASVLGALMALCSASVAETVIVETQVLPSQTNQVSFTAMTGMFWDSTAKSTAPGCTAFDTGPYGSKYAKAADSGAPAFTIAPNLVVAGGHYAVDVTHVSGNCSTDLVASISVTGGSGLPATTTGFRSTNGVNQWFPIGILALDSEMTNPAITFTYAGGALNASNRFIADAFRFTYLAPPTIVTQPESQTNFVGGPATFNVTAEGNPLPCYQWLFNSSPILNATNSSYTISTLQKSNEGTYSVIVSNAGGVVTSSNAFLSVVVIPPSITAEPPEDRTVFAGSNVLFTVSADGSLPMSFQWQFNGVNLATATTSSFLRANVKVADSGDYRVTITNLAGAVTSRTSHLTVINNTISIGSQPQDISTNAGTSVAFAVSASGVGLLSYQWLFNGTNIAGATGTSYTMGNVQQTNAGIYSVIVSNTNGPVLSSNAVLTVHDTLPIIVSEPANQLVFRTSNAFFTVTTTGTDPRVYQWSFNGTNVSGATSASYYVSNAQFSNSGSYQILISNSLGSATSAVATLTVVSRAPVILTQPLPRTNNAGTIASFSVTAQAGLPFTYQWHFNGKSLPGATSSAYTISNVQQTNRGNYSVTLSNFDGAVTSTNAFLTVIDTKPIITVQPGPDQTLMASGSFALSVATTGSDPRRYQWSMNGTNITGATNTAFARTNVQVLDSGNYIVVISNAFGMATSSPVAITVLPAIPKISQQPQGRTVPEGSNVVFSVVAESKLPMYYQWRRNGTDLPGATGTSLWRFNAKVADTGTYTVVVGNSTGSTNSSNAVLTVTNAPPIILRQPTAQTACLGETAVFYVLTMGSEPRTYQWRCNGTAIANATDTSYTLVDCGPTNQGTYSVFISNRFGSVVSAGAALTVTDAPPRIVVNPANRCVMVDGCVTFSVVASGTRPLNYQWNYNGAPIPGAFESALTVYGVQPEYAGEVSVQVSNNRGTADSAPATLSVTNRPFFDPISADGSNNVVLSWGAIPGRSYRVEYSTDLGSTNWTALDSDITAGDCTATKLDPTADPPRFYRLLLLP